MSTLLLLMFLQAIELAPGVDATAAIQAEIARVVPTWEVKKQAIEQGYWAAIVMASEVANSNQQVRGLAISALAWLDDPKIENIDFSLESTQQLVGGLVLTTLITQQQGEALIALGSETVSFASTIVATTINAGDIRDAKGRA